MSEEKKYAGVSPELDFNKALRKMLLSFDALEDESVPFEQYPHNDFAKYFMEHVKGLHKNGDLNPVSFMHIPFAIAKGNGKIVSENTKKNYALYVVLLMDQLDLSVHEKLDKKLAEIEGGKKEEKTISDLKNHLEMYRELNGERIFELETFQGWKGWNPGLWKFKKLEQSIPIGDLERIGEEFEFSYAMSCLAQKCENRGEKQWIPYFCGLVDAEEAYSPDKTARDLDKLREFLKKDYKSIIDDASSIEYLQDNLKYFNPSCMTKDEMNKFFICSIIICAKSKETPYVVFYKRVCLYGRFNKIHCFPIDYIESDDLEKQKQCRIKIKVLNHIYLNEGFKFPSKDKLKKVDEDWSKSIKILSFKEPYNIVFSMLCNLFELLEKFENIGNTGNQEHLKENKKTLDKAFSVYPILDWIDPDLDHPSDRNHLIFATCIKAICKYSTNPEEYNKKILEYGIALIPYIQTQLAHIEEFSSLVENTDNSIVPELYSLIGFTERIFYPCKFRPTIDKEVVSRIVELRNYLTDQSNHSVITFRSLTLMGKIFVHRKITKFITIPDFEKNITWGMAFRSLALNIKGVFSSKAKENIQEQLKSCDPNIRDVLVKQLENQDVVNQATQAIEASLMKTVAQSGKINLENDNPEKPIS